MVQSTIFKKSETSQNIQPQCNKSRLELGEEIFQQDNTFSLHIALKTTQFKVVCFEMHTAILKYIEEILLVLI